MFLGKLFKKGNRSKGATAMEYVLICTLITTACVVGYRRVGSGYQRIFNNIANAI